MVSFTNAQKAFLKSVGVWVEVADSIEQLALEVKVHPGDACRKCGSPLDQSWYRVDLSVFDFAGSCNCEYWEIQLAPKVAGQSREERLSNLYVCAHIEAARVFALQLYLRQHQLAEQKLVHAKKVDQF